MACQAMHIATPCAFARKIFLLIRLLWRPRQSLRTFQEVSFSPRSTYIHSPEHKTCPSDCLYHLLPKMSESYHHHLQCAPFPMISSRREVFWWSRPPICSATSAQDILQFYLSKSCRVYMHLCRGHEESYGNLLVIEQPKYVKYWLLTFVRYDCLISW